jgi:hypothetical protein
MTLHLRMLVLYHYHHFELRVVKEGAVNAMSLVKKRERRHQNKKMCRSYLQCGHAMSHVKKRRTERSQENV